MPRSIGRLAAGICTIVSQQAHAILGRTWRMTRSWPAHIPVVPRRLHQGISGCRRSPGRHRWPVSAHALHEADVVVVACVRLSCEAPLLQVPLPRRQLLPLPGLPAGVPVVRSADPASRSCGQTAYAAAWPVQASGARSRRHALTVPRSDAPSGRRSALRALRFVLQKTSTWPLYGSSSRAVCTFDARPLKPERISVTPAASQTRIPAGRPIIHAAFPGLLPTLPDRTGLRCASWLCPAGFRSRHRSADRSRQVAPAPLRPMSPRPVRPDRIDRRAIRAAI